MVRPQPESDAIVLLPAHNEVHALPAVLYDLRQQWSGHVLVIDDCSDDGTANVARAAGVPVLPMACQLGAWGATQAGIRYALRRGYRFVLTMDADGQHRAGDLDRLLAPLRAGAAEVAIGSFTERGSRLRRVAWWLMKGVSGIDLADVTSGLRAYDRRAAALLGSWRASLCSYQDIGVLALLLRAGLRIHDVPVVMRPRRHGHSRVFSSWLTVAYYMMHTLLLGATKRPLRSRRFLPAGTS